MDRAARILHGCCTGFAQACTLYFQRAHIASKKRHAKNQLPLRLLPGAICVARSKVRTQPGPDLKQNLFAACVFVRKKVKDSSTLPVLPWRVLVAYWHVLACTKVCKSKRNAVTGEEVRQQHPALKDAQRL